MPLRNLESHFAELPSTGVQRSRFDMGSSHKTSWNVGQLIPYFWMEVLPADTIQMRTSFVARLQTLLTPIMDDLYLETAVFFCPYRILWDHYAEFMGENKSGSWIPETEYFMPMISSPSGGFDTGTIADYLGIPPGVEFGDELEGINVLPFRAYASICNEWYRDQNLQDPINIYTGDSTVVGSNGSDYVNDVPLGGKPFVASKLHDQFTSCLPGPQKGSSPTVTTVPQQAPVYGSNVSHDHSNYAVHVQKTGSDGYYLSVADSVLLNQNISGSQSQVYASVLKGTDPALPGQYYFHPDNLYADVAAESIFDINQIRLAFQLQKFLEKDARGGTRLREVIKSHFDTTVPDARVMIPEYLGGSRVPLSIHQVANTAQSSSGDLGDVGAMSNTSSVHDDMIRSFTEHGILMAVAVVRYPHSYSQGLERFWSKSSRTDFYWPVFASLGEVPVRKKEIYFAGDGNDNDVFGYQEAWYDYRYRPNRISGEMRPGITNSLASWHLSDYYQTAPTLSSAWIQEDASIVDRVLAVSSSNANQIFGDFYVDCKATRPMPLYSIPGLIDHF